MFVRSLRETDFPLFKKCLEDMRPWLASLDHIHYFRWLSVFLNDLDSLPQKKEVFEALCKNFTIKRSTKKFSSRYKAHEQNNKIVKTDGRAIGIFDNEQALLDWTISGPYIADMLSDFGGTANKKSSKHHEDSVAFEKKFRLHRQLLIGSFLQFGNPFMVPLNGLQNIVSKEILAEENANSVSNALKVGEAQSKHFTAKRIKRNVEETMSLYSHEKQITTVS